ncbi:type I methionyl aminopeptidase [Candidatus Pacebacteria bacterium]|nr:type I methionyl aminopeptidase [Candidatus Paceibacterota bacterium]
MSITLKTEDAIKKLRKGGKIHAAILDELEKVAVVGNTTLDIDDRAMELAEEYGVQPLLLGYQPQFSSRPFPAATCISINDILVHGIPNEDSKTIEDGDIVSIDLVTGYDGVVLDAARTIGVGNISPEAKVLLDVTKAALKAGVHAAQPGNRVKDIGKAIEAVVPEGYGIVEALSGHGVGYEIHEEPMVPNFVMKGESPELVPGMVIAIEPMIVYGDKDVIFDEHDGYTVFTADGNISAHMEHTVLITKKGPEILTIK